MFAASGFYVRLFVEWVGSGADTCAVQPSGGGA
jgi:hypothetical protein